MEKASKAGASHEDETSYCSAAFDFTSTGPNQLNLYVGEKVLAYIAELDLEEMDDWVWCKHLRSNLEGYVPSTYLRVESQDVVERAMIREDIARLENSVESEQRIVAGFEEAIRSSKKASDKAAVTEKLKESRKLIYDMLNHLERLHARLGSNADDEEEEEESEDDTPKPPPIKPFTGVLKPCIWKAKRRGDLKVRFEIFEKRARPAASMPARPRSGSANGAETARKGRRKSESTEDISDFSEADWSGYLWEERPGGRGWKRRFGAIKGESIFIYRRPKPGDHALRIDLGGVSVVILTPNQVTQISTNEEAEIKYCFRLIQNGVAPLTFAAESASEMEGCVSLLMKGSKSTKQNGRQLRRDAKRVRRRSTEASLSQEGLALKALANLDLDDSGNSPTMRRASLAPGAEARPSTPPATAARRGSLAPESASPEKGAASIAGRRSSLAPEASSSSPPPNRATKAAPAATAAAAPATASKPIPAAANAVTAAIASGGSSSSAAPLMQLMVANFDYKATDGRQLSVVKGDTVLKVDSVNEKWFTAFRERDRATGIVPTAYFKAL